MKAEIAKSIQEIPERQWEKLAPPDFPFASYQFLKALEVTGCIGARSGWTPLYLTLSESSALLGAYLLFAKTHSYGEYIFDFGWAQAHEGMGLRYYPKLVSAIPFTPATGPKILLSRDLGAEKKNEISRQLLSAAQDLYNQTNSSSLHTLFLPENEIPLFQEAGHWIRHSYQYHWKNRGFKNFDAFLQSLRSKRRKEILRERQQVQHSGVKIQRLTGDELKPEHAERMHQFYLSTIDKMAGFDYLTADFFQNVFETMKDHLLFVLATDSSGTEVAGALNFFGTSTLYGRHWGCLENYRALHFEVCYYQGIEFALERNFQLFEAGAQGEHKFQRGFLPNLTYSAHQIKNPKLQGAIQDLIRREKTDIDLLFKAYQAHTPYSREPENHL